MRTKIIYEDDAMLIVRKPAGLAVQTAKIGQPDVISELKNYLAEKRTNGTKGAESRKEPYIGVIHRLDQPVEGLLVFARTRMAAKALTAQLAEGELNKEYYAAVLGEPIQGRGRLENYLYKDKNQKAQILTPGQPHFEEAKRAVLNYRILQRAMAGLRVCLAKITIETGRFHQIRAQMAYAGMPLLGDRKYGDEKAIEVSEMLNIKTPALCAFSITLRHPRTGRQIAFHTLPEGRAFSLFVNASYGAKDCSGLISASDRIISPEALPEELFHPL